MRGIRLAAVGGCVTLTSFMWLPPAVAGTIPAAVAAPCPQGYEQPGSPASQMTAQPWPETMLNFTDVWPLTKGKGVTVAVLDSGVDAGHPQLTNVTKTVDLTHTNLTDCVGHGTGVAGIIGGQDLRPTKHIPFYGVAPDAKIISIKIANQKQNNNSALVGPAIEQAVDLHAKIINLSVDSPDTASLRSAVKYATDHDVLIVASAGNITDKNQQPQKAYPASYPGVLSVGAIDEKGQLASDFSNTVTPVTVVAPGQNIISTFPSPPGTYILESGTSFAAPYVAGTAALVWSHSPKMTYLQVKQAIEGTADGGTVTGTGAGVVNPLRAVTAVDTGRGGVPTVAAQPAVRPVTILQPEPVDHFGRMLALSIAGAALTVATVVSVIGVVVPAGRRRGWRPDRRTTGRPPAA